MSGYERNAYPVRQGQWSISTGVGRQVMMSSGLGPAAPIFRVSGVRASIVYYTERLGFSHDWGESGLASVSRGGCTIFLCEWDQGRPGTWVWVGVDDAGALHEELVRRGARIRHPPTNYEWAFELQVEDLDGNVLRLGSDSKEGLPYGDFLDASGVLWRSAEDGSWRASDDRRGTGEQD